MIRALTIVTAVAAFAVTAGPASAGTSKKPPPRTAQVIVLIGANDYGLVATFGAGKDRGWVKAPPKPRVPEGQAESVRGGILLGEGLVGQMEVVKGGRVAQTAGGIIAVLIG